MISASRCLRHASVSSRGGGAGEPSGSWGSRNRFISFMSRGICLMTGFGLSYSFTNPDQDTVYEVFPLQNQTKYAFIHLYQVEEEKRKEFEERIKDLSRFNQQQQGYLYTRLFRLKKDLSEQASPSSSSSPRSPEDVGSSSSSTLSSKRETSCSSSSSSSSASSALPLYDYFQITTWLAVEDHLLARDKPVGQSLRSLLPLKHSSSSSSFLYQNVADDTKYTVFHSPPPSTFS